MIVIMRKIFKRWAVSDGIVGQLLPERFFWRKDAEDMRDAVEFLYVIAALQTGDEWAYPYFDRIVVVRA
jgi:hypothetical protein